MYFNNVANGWDTETRVKRAKILSEKILEQGDYKGKVALEIGCGTGLFTMDLCDEFKEIYCFDLAEEMINLLKGKIKSSNRDNIKIVEANEVYAECFYNKFDLVYSSMVFHHIKDIEGELKKIYSVLKNDGQVMIIDLDKEDGKFHKDEVGFSGYNGFERSSLKSILEKVGFREVECLDAFSGIKKNSDESFEYSLFLCKGVKRKSLESSVELDKIENIKFMKNENFGEKFNFEKIELQVDRDISLKTLEKCDKNIVNMICENCSDYYILHEGVKPNEKLVKEIFTMLPPDKSYRDKFVIGIYKDIELIGLVDIVKNFPVEGEWIIGLIVISKGERGMGIGEKVHNKLEEWAKEKGAKSLRLGVIEVNNPGMNFWRKLGYFEINNMVMEYEKKSHNMFVMRKIIE